MQAVIVIALVGFIYATIASIVSTVASSTVEMRERQVQRVKQMFQDVEHAVNNVILNQDVDLTNYLELIQGNGSNTSGCSAATINANLSELAGMVPWSAAELATDPWGGDIRVITQVARDADRLFRLVYAEPAPGRNLIGAPVRAFALVSGGPDGQIDSWLLTWAGNYRDVLAKEAAVGSDDIVHVFSTQDKMFSIWASIYDDLDNIIIPSVTDYYKQQHERFQEVVDYAYERLLAEADPGEASTFIEHWDKYGWNSAGRVQSGGVNISIANPALRQVVDMQRYDAEVAGVAVGAAHPVSGTTFYYPNIARATVEDLGLESTTFLWQPFQVLGFNAINSNAASPQFPPITSTDTRNAEEATMVQMDIGLLVPSSRYTSSNQGSGINGCPDTWTMPVTGNIMRMVIQGND